MIDEIGITPLPLKNVVRSQLFDLLPSLKSWFPYGECCGFLRWRSLFGFLLAASIIASAFFFYACSKAAAGDYSVTYAIDTGDKNDVGNIESCEYIRRCTIKSGSLGLSIDLRIIREDHAWVELEVNGPYGCCYSADANKTIYLEIKPTLQRVPIYEGRLRRRNEFVLNKKFGVLYIEFSNLR